MCAGARPPAPTPITIRRVGARAGRPGRYSMIGLFARLRDRRDVHEADPEERRTTLAEIEALLREIAAKPAGRNDWPVGRCVGPARGRGVGGQAQAGVLTPRPAGSGPRDALPARSQAGAPNPRGQALARLPWRATPQPLSGPAAPDKI